MVTIAMAQAKWERKTRGKGPKWKRAAMKGSAHYCPAFAKFIGAPISPAVCAAQRAGIEAVSAGDFSAAVAGKGPKWRRKLVAAVTGSSK